VFQQTSTNWRQWQQPEDLGAPSESTCFDNWPDRPSKPGAAGSSPAGRANLARFRQISPYSLFNRADKRRICTELERSHRQFFNRPAHVIDEFPFALTVQWSREYRPHTPEIRNQIFSSERPRGNVKRDESDQRPSVADVVHASTVSPRTRCLSGKFCGTTRRTARDVQHVGLGTTARATRHSHEST
jgi:hypothetical protein